jgi:hypothetical protein
VNTAPDNRPSIDWRIPASFSIAAGFVVLVVALLIAIS